MNHTYINPRLAFDEFESYLTLFTVTSDDKIEGQHFDRKEIPKPSAGHVPKSTLGTIKEAIRETVSAFANTNDGLLVIGISKLGSIVGVNHLTEEQLNSITSIGQLLRNHGSRVVLRDCVDSTGAANRLITIYVPECKNDLCLTIESRPRGWKRVALQNLPLEDRDIERIKRDKHIDSFERRLASPYRSQDLDNALIAEIRQTWLDGTNESRDDENLLHEFGALEHDTQTLRFTNAGLLFFSSNPQRAIAQAHIRILRYETTLGSNQPSEPSLDKTFSGSITNQLRDVRQFLRESGLIRVYHVRRPDGGFEEKPEIPFIVVDEAIVNAVAHRDYALEWPIECIYYRDALVVRNPGKLLQRKRPVNCIL